ncbi:MAG: EscU/YscU/HrcU family type III secretion system export apparatus switch protein [Pseudomonadota bacterium]
MSQHGSSDKTEKATLKRVRDARKRGQVANSRDLTQTITTFTWLAVSLLLGQQGGNVIMEFTELCWQLTHEYTTSHLKNVGYAGGRLVIILTLIPVAAVATCGALTDFLQTGPVFSTVPITPNVQHLNPVQGMKRLFGLENWLELLKGVLKTTLILGVTFLLFIQYLPDILETIAGSVKTYAHANHTLLKTLTIWVCVVLLVFAVLDWYLQKFLYQRNLRMSKQEVRDEKKGEYGDPQLRSQRRRLQRQWANGSAQSAVKTASAIVVNPTHIAVALEYDPETTPVPMVTAMGEGNLARMMRQLAEDNNVPVMRSIPLARRLYYLCEDDEFVPEELFEAVAEVIAWAESLKDQENARRYREADGVFDGLVVR